MSKLLYLVDSVLLPRFSVLMEMLFIRFDKNLYYSNIYISRLIDNSMSAINGSIMDLPVRL